MASSTGNDTPAHTNRLANETSPYLLQHAHNPVNWYPWGEEALERAKAEDKPIFLSIGYAACHWCHVMEHESFESEAIAEQLNAGFISIKVDREERPDLDDIYMAATLALNGQGGWPMSVFLTPDLRPFYAGTYYPPRDMYGRPGFPTLLNHITRLWNEQREKVFDSAEQLTDYVETEMLAAAAPPGPVNEGCITGAVEHLKTSFDAESGGWGGAPKFPSSGSIQVLLRHHAHTGDKRSLEMALFTLDAMANGGIHDHLGGGFHRYSVDAAWLVPHFEKMAYDNAQLAEAYLEAYQLTRNPRYGNVARAILDYELRDMRDPLGGFHSTEDADSEGQEGKFYLWTEKEILDALGPEDGAIFATFYNVRSLGNFSSHESYHEGQNILHVTDPLETVASDLRMSPQALGEVLQRGRQTLFQLREERVRPGLDDKVLTSWNALLISALAQAAQVLQEPRYRQAAEKAGAFILEHMQREGLLLRTHRKGESRIPAYLDDYAFTVNAFVHLYECTFDTRWLLEANRLAGIMIDAFWDAEGGAFFSTGAMHQHLIVRAKSAQDGAEPSGNSTAALALFRLAKLLDNEDYAEKAAGVLEANALMLERAPHGFLKMLLAVDFHVRGPREIAIAGDADEADTAALLAALHGVYVPNKIVAGAAPEMIGQAEALIPLLKNRTKIDGKAAAYVCKDFVCGLPVTTPANLREQLRNAPSS